MLILLFMKLFSRLKIEEECMTMMTKMGLAYNVHRCIVAFSINKACVENGH